MRRVAVSLVERTPSRRGLPETRFGAYLLLEHRGADVTGLAGRRTSHDRAGRIERGVFTHAGVHQAAS